MTATCTCRVSVASLVSIAVAGAPGKQTILGSRGRYPTKLRSGTRLHSAAQSACRFALDA